MNTARILTALVLVASSNFVFSMITMQKGNDTELGSYACYKKPVGQGHYLLYYNFEDMGLFRTCMELVDPNKPDTKTSEVLAEEFGNGGEFWSIAKEYKVQDQSEEKESKENAKSNECVAAKGQKFALEWYRDTKGNCQAQKYYEMLDDAQQNKFKNLFVELVAGSMPGKERFRNEGDNIYAFKAIPDRLLCFFTDNAKIIITNAFEKRTDKLSPAEKDLAVKARLDYLARCKIGTYYKK